MTIWSVGASRGLVIGLKIAALIISPGNVAGGAINPGRAGGVYVIAEL